jgi:hypothetical protein
VLRLFGAPPSSKGQAREVRLGAPNSGRFAARVSCELSPIDDGPRVKTDRAIVREDHREYLKIFYSELNNFSGNAIGRLRARTDRRDLKGV